MTPRVQAQLTLNSSEDYPLCFIVNSTLLYSLSSSVWSSGFQHRTEQDHNLQSNHKKAEMATIKDVAVETELVQNFTLPFNITKGR